MTLENNDWRPDRWSTNIATKLFGCIGWFCALFAVSASTLTGETLQPNQVAVIAAKNNRNSEQLAGYYIKQRGIPKENLLLIEFDDEDILSREKWDTSVRSEIAQWLKVREESQPIRCFVTMRGVPINIGPAETRLQESLIYQFIQGHRERLHRRLVETVNALNKLAIDSTEVSSPDVSINESTSTAELIQAYEKSVQQTDLRLQSIISGDRQPTIDQFSRLITDAGGLTLVIQNLNGQLQRGGSNLPEQQKAVLVQQFNQFNAAFQTLQSVLDGTESLVASHETMQIRVAVIERALGLVGALRYTDELIANFDSDDGLASFDSELSVLRRPAGFDLRIALPNGLNVKYFDNPLQVVYPTLMVSRIDGPTWPICKRLIDDAMAAEKSGPLQGQFYFDLRGIAQTSTANNFSQPERRLEDVLATLAGNFQTKFASRAVKNSEPSLFAAKSCPEIAIYCGWSSIGEYIDIGDWKLGSIGYHLSPISASDLHNTESQTWCTQMLQRGAAVVVGYSSFTTYDHFLRPSFCNPEGFDGDKTIVENVFAELEWCSVRFVLIGDPLYRPVLK